LSKPSLNSDFWNPSNADFFGNPPKPPQKIPVTEQVTDFRMPMPDPGEEFVHINAQLFGPGVIPAQTALHEMKGFALDYGSLKGCKAENIMQCYSTAQVPVITALAQSYAIGVDGTPRARLKPGQTAYSLISVRRVARSTMRPTIRFTTTYRRSSTC